MMRQIFVLFAVIALCAINVGAQTSKDIRQIYSLVSRSVLRDLQKEFPDRVLHVISESKLNNHSEPEWFDSVNMKSISLVPFLKRRNIVLIRNEYYEELRTKSNEEWEAKKKALPPSQIPTFEICGSHDMELFEKTYPKANGIYYFSRIGFEPKRKRALLLVEQYGGCGGSKQTFFLRQKRGNWYIFNVAGEGWVA